MKNLLLPMVQSLGCSLERNNVDSVESIRHAIRKFLLVQAPILLTVAILRLHVSVIDVVLQLAPPPSVQFIYRRHIVPAEIVAIHCNLHWNRCDERRGGGRTWCTRSTELWS